MLNYMQKRRIFVQGMRYILSDTYITSPGTYDFEITSLADAKDWLQAGGFASAIENEIIANALSILTGFTIGTRKERPKMKEGDEALVFRFLVQPNDPRLKDGVTPAFVIENCELGILRKILDEVE